MEKQIKTIGVLTSGGEGPGMNAAVRAVVRAGLHKGFRMIGIQRGYNGLLDGECFEMNLRSVSNIISAGGTILYTARCLEFKTKEGQDKGAANCRELGIDALVVIGGDGSYRGARELAHRGIPMIGLPGTIDNDIACTDYTIGYDTAMNTALEMIDKLRDTTQIKFFGDHMQDKPCFNIFSHCLRNIKLCRPFTVISFIICKDTWSVDTGCKLCTVHLLNCFQLKETCACIVRSNNVLC